MQFQILHSVLIRVPLARIIILSPIPPTVAVAPQSRVKNIRVPPAHSCFNSGAPQSNFQHTLALTLAYRSLTLGALMLHFGILQSNA